MDDRISRACPRVSSFCFVRRDLGQSAFIARCLEESAIARLEQPANTHLEQSAIRYLEQSAIKMEVSEGFYHNVRAHFPYFQSNKKHPVFFENAGGSQLPAVVIDAIGNYMRDSYVQLGARYELSKEATQMLADTHSFMKIFMNAKGVGEVVLGPSTSQLVANLSASYAGILSPGDEIVVQEANHEANAGPWVKLAKRGGFSLKFWKTNPQSFESSIDGLIKLLSPSTKIVAVTHVSNILGEILDLEKLVKVVKEEVGERVRVVADGVAYAPHRAIDVMKWGVDWYVFSTYKVYGPHMSALFGTFDAFDEVKDEGPNHFFIPSSDFSYKFELGGACHEGSAGILALSRYLKALAAMKHHNTYTAIGFDRQVVEAAFAAITQLEQPLQHTLLGFLKSKPDVVIIGRSSSQARIRMPTISFVHKTKSSTEIVKHIQKAGIATRNGHMYAYRLVTALVEQGALFGNSIDDGVVRISMVHYNTPHEVSLLMDCLDKIL